MTGTVVVHPGGKPLRGARIEAELAGREVATETDAAGQFSLPGIPTGETFTLEIEAADDVMPEQQAVAVPGGAVTFEVGTIRMLVAPDWHERLQSAGSLGMRPIQRDGRLLVGDLRSGGAAARAGLAASDVLLSVDGHSLEGLGLGAAYYHVLRPPGTRVSLTVLTATGQPRTVVLVPDPR